MYEQYRVAYHLTMNQREERTSAINSYLREVERLKNFSPEWKPISLKKYIQEYQRRLKAAKVS